MKTRYITLVLCGMLSAGWLSSCIDDNSKYGDNPIPSLSVTVPTTDPDKLPEVNFNYGEECVIEPKINYDGTGELKYEWSVGTLNNGVKGELKVVSDKPILNYSFDSGGSYYAHLKITDGIVGVVQEYQVNINRTFEQGYMVISSNREDIGNLVFIKDLTPEDKEAGITSIIMEHCIERVNENATPENITGVVIARYNDFVTGRPVPVTRVVVGFGSKTMFLDPNTFVSLSTTYHQNIIPGFKARFLIGGTNTTAYDPEMKKGITVRGSSMLGVEASLYTGHDFETVFYGTDYRYGTQYYNNYFVKRQPLSISYIGSNTGTWGDDKALTYGDSPLFQNHKLINVFMGEQASTIENYPSYGEMTVNYDPCYVLTQETSTGKYYYTHLYMKDASPACEIKLMDRREIACDGNTAIPAIEGPIAVSSTYHRIYYSNDNRVYAMTMNNGAANWPAINQSCIEFPANEEVTYMTINTNTQELIVATTDKTTNRGNVYIYDAADVRTDNPGATPKLSYPDCADRISFIVYKPRVANS